MRVTVRLYAAMRERAGAPELDLEVPDGATVADVAAALRREPSLAGMSETPFRVAVNRQYADEDQPVAQGDELAVITPVSGGSPEADAAPRVSAQVTGDPLSLDVLVEAVRDPRAGAIVTFEGTTREVELLRYEAYEEMAAERIEAILRECTKRHGLCAAAAAHRVGEVPLAEPSVIVAASAPHRPEAFAGAREAIDRIKAQAPIWKREGGGGEGEWVEGTLP